MREAHYKAEVSTPFGVFTVIVLSTAECARHDIYSATCTEFPYAEKLLRIREVQKTNRRLLQRATPIKKCTTIGSLQWGWII